MFLDNFKIRRIKFDKIEIIKNNFEISSNTLSPGLLLCRFFESLIVWGYMASGGKCLHGENLPEHISPIVVPAAMNWIMVANTFNSALSVTCLYMLT